jgi:hypothetical protein
MKVREKFSWLSNLSNEESTPTIKQYQFKDLKKEISCLRLKNNLYKLPRFETDSNLFIGDTHFLASALQGWYLPIFQNQSRLHCKKSL